MQDCSLWQMEKVYSNEQHKNWSQNFRMVFEMYVILTVHSVAIGGYLFIPEDGILNAEIRIGVK
jgi:hypothetical protein